MAPIPEPSESSGDATLAVSGVVIVLALLSVVLRFYTRRFTRLGLGADDWLILVAVIATLLTAVLLLWGNSVDPDGLWVSENTDPDYLYTAEDVFYLKLSFASSILYFTIAGATKLGILLMYYRIFAVSTAFRYQLFLSVALVIGWWIGCTIATLTNCIPLEWSWNNSLADPRYCFNYNIFWMASGACEIFLDVLILTLPISVVVRMRLSARRKVTVSIIFLLGGFTIVTGLIKVILGYPPNSRVPSYSNTEVWTTVHAGLAIVCASLPIFRPLVRRISQLSLISKASTLFPVRHSSKQPTPISLEMISEPSTYQKASVGGRNAGSLREDEEGFFLGLPRIEAVENSTASLSAQLARFIEQGETINTGQNLQMGEAVNQVR
ncbi:hypothetical protein F4813DRAFT_352100 [Daldinia decipiens]|uniref:uncharacterized protein n=1 Tax=Daldinia decipiens TaxID=326647 RepID=UPI0020C588CF|nr:uncharacterized protein F4813DRAFT_352100 [Daldinia decipiens]KAI1659827.1 hypothetical protein F4813DRAFT_352100 [Daldinia decipiens]